MKPASYFVTGTDTGIGKTVVSTILAVGMGARYWKPIQTGAREGSDSAFVADWAGRHNVAPETYIFSEPVSPHLAAELEDTEIQIERCLEDFAKIDGPVIVEGAGGALVPIHPAATMADLMLALRLPVLVVANTRLGAINHTLLTLEALRGRGLEVAGVISVGESSPSFDQSIWNYAQTRMLGHVPYAKSFSLNWLQETFRSAL